MTPQVVAIGEVLWDMLPAGKQLGGAPANFAVHAAELGLSAALISRVGRDALGEQIHARFQSRGLPTDTLQIDPAAPTGTVDVTVDAAGQPMYTIQEHAAWDFLAVTPEAYGAMEDAFAVCFGSLGQRSMAARSTVRELLSLPTLLADLRMFDVNLRPPFWTPEVIKQSLLLANSLKLNDHELPILADQFGIAGNDCKRLKGLAEKFNLKLVALTRGAHGSLLLADGQWSDHPGVPVTVQDAVGAGDAFTAALVVGWLRGRDLDEINDHANRVAAYVCSQRGATPDLPESLKLI